MTCDNCEIGQCPCHSGCDACAHTGTCPDCNGTTHADVLAIGNERMVRMASRGRVWCPACRRYTYPHAEVPDFEDVRETRPHYYAKMVTLERCRGCHVPFQDARGRSFGYKLRERAAA